VLIATIGALTCLMRAPVGDIVTVPGGSELGPAILAEAAAVSAAAGYPVSDAENAATARSITQEGSQLASSMFRDLTEGRPVEVEPILGDFVSRAAALGVPTTILDLATLHLRVYERERPAARS
jgi:2-dehydropantoate 2-reductase